MRYLSTLYVRSHRARMGCRRGSLIVSRPEGKQCVPLEGVDAVVVLGGAQMTMQAIGECAGRGDRLAVLRRNGAVRFVVNGATGGNVHLRMALFRVVADDCRALAIANAIVAAKLQNSAKVVGRWSRDDKDVAQRGALANRADQIRLRIPRLEDAPSADHVRGIEGDAARIYFGAMGRAVASTELRFCARTRRPPRDPVNAMLGFCYGMLVMECIGALESVGLDFQMGFFHRPRSGRPSLAPDLAEEMLALTDRFVVSLVRRRQVSQDSFQTVPGGAVYQTEDGRDLLINAWEEHKETEVSHRILGQSIGRWALPSVQTTLLARHLRGDLPAYPPFVLA